MARYPLLRELRKQGWTITHTRGGHLKATHPGASGFLILPVSPSDWRATRNARAQARRLLQSAEAVPERNEVEMSTINDEAMEAAVEEVAQGEIPFPVAEPRRAVRVEHPAPKRAKQVAGPPKEKRTYRKSPLTLAREEMITTAVVDRVWFRVELDTVEAGDAKTLEALRSALGAVARSLGLRRADYQTMVRAGAVYVGPGRKKKEEGNEH